MIIFQPTTMIVTVAHSHTVCDLVCFFFFRHDDPYRPRAKRVKTNHIKYLLFNVLSFKWFHSFKSFFSFFFIFWSDYFVYYYDSWHGSKWIVSWGLVFFFFFAVCNVMNSLLEIAWWVESHKIDGNTTRWPSFWDLTRGAKRERKKNCDCKQMEFLVFQFVYQFISNHMNKTCCITMRLFTNSNSSDHSLVP